MSSKDKKTASGTDSEEARLLVQKSLPLFSLWCSPLTLAEFKILDTYLAKINSHKPEDRVVVIEKGELERLLGMEKINRADLEKRLLHLMESVVRIDDDSVEKGFRLVTLFEQAVAEQNEYGLWQVHLECTASAMKYFFNIEEIGYLRYKLRCITNLSSRYSYILFTYLEHNRFRKTWEVALQELKIILNCENEPYCETYKVFNARLLKRVQTELHEKTDCRFSYEPVKLGRTVVAVRFTIETDPRIFSELVDEQTEAQLSVIESDDSMTDEKYEQLLSEYGTDEMVELARLMNFEFDEAQIQLIWQVLNKIDIPKDSLTNDTFFGKVKYITEKYAKLNVEASKKSQKGEKINNRFDYFIAMLKNEISD